MIDSWQPQENFRRLCRIPIQPFDYSESQCLKFQHRCGNLVGMMGKENTRVESLIEICKKSAVDGMEMFLRNFSHVPDDKLTWAPVPTAKTAIQIAAHTAVTAGNFAEMLRARKLPIGDEIPVFVARTATAAEALTTREEVISVFQKNTEEVLAALDTLTPEEIDMVLDSSLGWTMPMTFLMKLPGIHAFIHTGQIDFLQTCWDDQEVHF